MTAYTLALLGVFILEIAIGAMLSQVLQTLSRRRREREHARRQFEREIQALREDFGYLRPEVNRMLNWRRGPSWSCSKRARQTAP
jgi:hypothetical protein